MITFPPPMATDPSDARGPVSLTRGTDRWLVGFNRGPMPSGLVVRAYDFNWNPLTPAQPLSGAGSYGVASLNGSSALAVWGTSLTAANVGSALDDGRPCTLPSEGS